MLKHIFIEFSMPSLKKIAVITQNLFKEKEKKEKKRKKIS